MADEDVVDDAAAEREASEMGWEPKEKFRGAPEKWVDAKTYVERGRAIMPILKKNNERLASDVSALRGEIGGLKETLKAAQAVIDTLNASHEEDVKAQVEAARAALRDELAVASEAGDHKAVAAITDQMTQLGKAEDKADVRDDKNAKPGTGEDVWNTPVGREVKAWYEQHPAFSKDRRKVALATAITVELRERGNTKLGAAFLDDVAAEVEKALDSARDDEGGDSKVGSGNGGGGRRPGGGKTYADLPADVKAVCDSQAKRLVGPNRAHKDIASWRKSYVQQYFGDQS